MIKHKLGACVAAFAAVTIAQPAAAQGQWSFAAGVDYSNGDYGQADDTTIIEAPFTAAYNADNWSFWLTAPYVHVEGPGGIAPAGGGGGLLGGILGAGAADAQAAGPVDEQGLGDITIGAATRVWQNDSGLTLTALGSARLPTGDEERSLGTGETSATAGVVLRQALSVRTGLFGSVGASYAFESEADGVFVAAGADTYVSDRMQIGASVNWSEANSALRRDSMQVGAFAGYDLNDHARIGAHVGVGLTDTSPDTVAGIGLVLRR